MNPVLAKPSLVLRFPLSLLLNQKLKNWCFWTLVLDKTVESPLDCQEIKSINPKGSQPWIFIGRTDAEAEAPMLWPPDVKSQLIGKDPDAAKDWGQEQKWSTDDEMVGWHHQLNGHESVQTPGGSEGQGNLVWYSPWGHKESDTTERLNNNNQTTEATAVMPHCPEAQCWSCKARNSS